MKLRESSINYGVGVEHSPLLVKSQPRGTEATLETTLFTLRELELIQGKTKKVESGYKKHMFIGDNWHIVIYGKGEKIKFRRGAISAGTSRTSTLERPSVRVSRRIPDVDQVKLARSFAEEVIAKIVDFSKQDELVPLYTLQETTEAFGPDRNMRTKIVGSVVVFGRKAFGLNVVGAGSKIAVMMSATGELEGFDVDWPRYSISERTVENIDGKKQRERINALLSKNFSKVELGSIECGYVDFGFIRRTKLPKTVQTGCQVSYTPVAVAAEKNLIDKTPRRSYVPAAETVVEGDSFWPELIDLGKAGDTCTEVQPAAFQQPT